MKKRKTNRAVIIILLLIFCAAAFLGVVFAIDRLSKAIYPIKYQDLVEKYAEEYELDPYIIYSVINTESGFKPNARSSADAIGLMQITEETFAWIKSKIAKEEDIQFEGLFNPDTAIRFGSYYMKISLEKYENDLSTAAAAYHSGWGTVDKLLQGENYAQNQKTLTSFPYKQMNLYVKKIQKNYEHYYKLYKID